MVAIVFLFVKYGSRSYSILISFLGGMSLILLLVHQAALGFVLGEWSVAKGDMTISTSMVLSSIPLPRSFQDL